MYAYTVEAYLDYETELMLKNLWINLSINNITYYGIENGGKRPHITIASYGDVDGVKFAEEMNEYYQNQKQVSISLDKIGSFLDTGTLYFTPTLSKQLLDFHNNHHEHFAQYNADDESFYLPGKWTPHCTIASRMDDEKIAEGFKYCRDNIKKTMCTIKEIVLIRNQIDDNGAVIDREVAATTELIE